MRRKQCASEFFAGRNIKTYVKFYFQTQKCVLHQSSKWINSGLVEDIGGVREAPIAGQALALCFQARSERPSQDHRAQSGAAFPAIRGKAVSRCGPRCTSHGNIRFQRLVFELLYPFRCFFFFLRKYSVTIGPLLLSFFNKGKTIPIKQQHSMSDYVPVQSANGAVSMQHRESLVHLAQHCLVVHVSVSSSLSLMAA